MQPPSTDHVIPGKRFTQTNNKHTWNEPSAKLKRESTTGQLHRLGNRHCQKLGERDYRLYRYYTRATCTVRAWHLQQLVLPLNMADYSSPLFWAVVAALFIFLCLLRFIYLASLHGQPANKKRTAQCKTLIVVGAGGHSMEMCRLLSGLNLELYAPRVYVIASNDNISTRKVEKFELDHCKNSSPDVRHILRARNVHQSYFTSVFTTVMATLRCLPLVASVRPDLVLCNGPGTCIPVCLTAYFMRFFFIKTVKIVYVESICRVDHLSLSAMLVYYIADQLLVQWPLLAVKYPRAKYIGRLIWILVMNIF